jgi:hypothetical protein
MDYSQLLNMYFASQGLPTAVPTTQVALPVGLAPETPIITTAAPAPQPVLSAPSITPVEDETTKARNQYRQQADSTFGVDYGRRNISSSLLDDAISSILSEQKNDATNYLERGRKRGIYNDTGYNAGVANIGTSFEAGRSRLGDLGRGVIDKYRADADAVRDKAYSAASAFTPGSSFSLDPYINEGNEVIGRANTFAKGDLLNAFGGTKLFDFGSLNNAAGQAQGAIGGRDLDVISAISQRKRANSLGRGLGSRGAF